MAAADPTTLDLVLKVIGGLSAVTAVATGSVKAAIWAVGKRKAARAKQLLETDAFAKSYGSEQLRAASEFYVEPDCASVDPSHEVDLRNVLSTREPLFSAMDRYLDSPKYRYFLLLADSGMGKTAFVLNYYLRNRLRADDARKRIAVVPLSAANADEQIAAITEPEKTILLLDSFDEDAKAIDDYQKRIGELVRKTAAFHKLLVTCRTQFFKKDDEIPQLTGVTRVGVLPLGEKREFEFFKLYLQPLDDRQVETYLKRRCSGPGKRKLRGQAAALVKDIGDLAARPMLLTYVPELLDKKQCRYGCAYEIYNGLVEGWFQREDCWFKGAEAQIRVFCLDLAVDVWKHRKTRGAEQLSHDELLGLIPKYGLTLVDPKLVRSRLLLNRTGDGFFKFAHRSIMEYLVVRARLEGRKGSEDLEWSDQMTAFLRQALESGTPAKGASLQGADLRGCNLRRTDLTGANLTGTNLAEATFDFGIIRAARLDFAKSPDLGVTEPTTGIRFRYVPGGQFRMGGDAHADERPAHWVEMSPFWIAETPVTNGQYNRFIEATRHRKPEQGANQQFSSPDQPVVGVDWNDAVAFCAWLSAAASAAAALPTEAQWEYAARGTDGREYPWGNEPPDATRACYSENSGGHPATVGSYPAGRGPFGTLDQAGNVWEWCRDVWDAQAYQKRAGKAVSDPIVTEGNKSMHPLRGGSWVVSAECLRSTSRLWLVANYRFYRFRFDLIGFRCVISAPSG
jgi:formylglycine-generating enzyme required for sulfatase activity